MSHVYYSATNKVYFSPKQLGPIFEVMLERIFLLVISLHWCHGCRRRTVLGGLNIQISGSNPPVYVCSLFLPKIYDGLIRYQRILLTASLHPLESHYGERKIKLE
jgi:hypothetical protein